jgi:predicted nucleotidyltransferase
VDAVTESMPLTRETLSNRLTLDAALTRLATHDLVDGLALFGSRAGSAALPASDHDLLVLVSSPPVGIFQMLTHIEGHMAGVVFVLTARADRLLGAVPVAASSSDGRFWLKMQTARIVYDASGRLGHAQELARRGGWQAVSGYGDKYGAWFWHNFDLYQMRRMARADDPVYQTAVDLMLCGGLSDICRAYYKTRHLPWEGEKTALCYLRQHDPAYLALLRECLAADDRAHKLQLFAQLVANTLGPVGPLWEPGSTAVVLDGPDASQDQVEAALNFWESLFA